MVIINPIILARGGFAVKLPHPPSHPQIFRVIAITLPAFQIGFDVFADFVQGFVVSDDAVIIITLPRNGKIAEYKKST
jgi:hypothetical protein